MTLYCCKFKFWRISRDFSDLGGNNCLQPVKIVARITYTVFGGDVKPCSINQSINQSIEATTAKRMKN